MVPIASAMPLYRGMGLLAAWSAAWNLIFTFSRGCRDMETALATQAAIEECQGTSPWPESPFYAAAEEGLDMINFLIC